jgi:hypothetical protein
VAAKAYHPDRVDRVLAMAPDAAPQTRNPFFDWMRDNPFVPGQWKMGVKSTLRDLFGTPPEALANEPEAFYEGLYRLLIGVDDFNFRGAVRGQSGIHILAVPGDSVGPPDILEEAAQGAGEQGSFTLAPEEYRGKHFITGLAPEYAAEWAMNALTAE